MEKTMLWEAFSRLNPMELKALGRFVQSPYFNRKKQVILLYAYLKECLENKVLPLESAAFKAAFPLVQKFDDQKLRLANSDLLRQLEHFWLIEKQAEDKLQQRIQLASLFRKRGLDKHARIALRESKALLQETAWKNAQYFERLHELELETYLSASAAKRYEDFNLQEISDLIDLHFLTRKLRHVCVMLSHQAVVRKDYSLKLYEALLPFIRNMDLEPYPALRLYFHASQFLAHHEADWHFQRFREHLIAQDSILPREEQRELFLLAINFGITKSNSLGQPWYRETFLLYKTALERDLLSEHGRLSRFAYNNIVSIATRNEEIEWAEYFIEQYKPFLERKYRESAFSLNAARLAYLRQDYGAALLYLQKADYKDFINSLNAKMLQMKIYYETAAYDLLESHLESMQNFIRRQRAVGYHRENYLNVIRFTRALLRCKSLEEKQRLQQSITATAVLTEKNWLVRMLEAVS